MERRERTTEIVRIKTVVHEEQQAVGRSRRLGSTSGASRSSVGSMRRWPIAWKGETLVISLHREIIPRPAPRPAGSDRWGGNDVAGVRPDIEAGQEAHPVAQARRIGEVWGSVTSFHFSGSIVSCFRAVYRL